MHKKLHLSLVFACAAALVAGCVSGTGAKVAQVTPATPSAAGVAAPAPAPDPVADLIAASDRHFAQGQQELSFGYLERAKAAFNLALDTLLESPQGARGDARLQQHFDRLVDQVSALEQAALAAGDGFTETGSDPASIDVLLAIPLRRGRRPPRPCGPTCRPPPTTSRFPPTTACCGTWSCSRGACASSSPRGCRGGRSTCR